MELVNEQPVRTLKWRSPADNYTWTLQWKLTFKTQSSALCRHSIPSRELMIDIRLVAVNVFARRVLISFSVDEMLLPRLVNLTISFRELRIWFLLKHFMPFCLNTYSNHLIYSCLQVYSLLTGNNQRLSSPFWIDFLNVFYDRFNFFQLTVTFFTALFPFNHHYHYNQGMPTAWVPWTLS